MVRALQRQYLKPLCGPPRSYSGDPHLLAGSPASDHRTLADVQHSPSWRNAVDYMNKSMGHGDPLFEDFMAHVVTGKSALSSVPAG